jgi:hypothetical protein
MSTSPIICFGQQPCGVFPRRFLVAKVLTARRIQKEIGGEIVWFYHDSDHDPRETRMLLRHRVSSEISDLNFTFENKLQRKFAPLFLKRISPDWKRKAANKLSNYVEKPLVDAFNQIDAINVADFCLEMYCRLGLLDGVRVVRSSDPDFRSAACDVVDFYVDVQHGGEIVRARQVDGALVLHEGGDSYLTLPAANFSKRQISPTRDSRLKWMQSVVRCTHYVAGASEQDYLCKSDAPEITYIARDAIERSDEAYTEFCHP